MPVVSSDITMVVTTIPPRLLMRRAALESIWAQSLQPDSVVVAMDNDRRGAAYTRDRGLAAVRTEWVGFLDDDDVLYPQHLAVLRQYVTDHPHVDLAYPWFDVEGGTDPFPEAEGRAWNDAAPHQIPITVLARTAALRAVGGYSYGWDLSQGEDPGLDASGNRAGEDFRLILRLIEAGYRIEHVNARTWCWAHHGQNTSGLPSRW